MLIQTPKQEGENVLTREALELHLEAALAASKVQVSLYGKSWDLNKICYKSGVPIIENGMIERMIEKLFPCVILTPLDCFWDGAKLQGGSAYLPGRPDIQWTNLDPVQLLEELGQFTSLEGFRELLDKAQVGQAYVERPCLNPREPACPASAPNRLSQQDPDIPAELTGGCHGFSRKFMHWQEELILGGTTKDPQGRLLSPGREPWAPQLTDVEHGPTHVSDTHRDPGPVTDRALRPVSLQAAVVVVFNFAMVLLIFPAILSLDLHRRQDQRLDVLCCFYSPCSSRVIQIQPQEYADANENHASHPSPYGHPAVATSTQITTTVQAFTRCDPSGRHVVTILPPTAQVCTAPLAPADPLGSQLFAPASSTRDLLAQLDGAKGGRECVPLPLCRWNLADFAREKYAPLLLQTQTKGIVVLLFLALLGLSLYGSTLVHDGLYLTDIVPRGTKEHAFIATQSKYFSFYHVFIATKGGFHYPSSQEALYGPQPLEFAQFPFYLSGLRQTADFVEAIESVRAVCEEAARERGVASYPSGYPFLFWEQYIGLRHWFLLAVSIVLACTFLVCAVLLLNPWTAGIIVAVLAMMTVELFGMMGLMGIKLSAIPAVILIASVGIGVEFTVHVALGFLTAMGSRTLRSALALEHTLAPVLDGALSTLLGLLMLAGSEFDFILRYFFAVLTVLTVLGLLNGLVLLPVLLSVIGPPAEVIPADNGSRLPSPEPIPPPISHHGFYMRPPPAWPGAFADSLDSEYYSESTAGSGLTHPQPYDPGAYILPPAPARVLVQASKNPSFPTITVVKTYQENQEPPGKKEPPSTNQTQSLAAGDSLPSAGPDLRDLPQHRLPRPGPPGARTVPHRAPRPLRTALPAYSGSYTTVTATASVTLALHPPLPGSLQGYTHDSYEDSESDCPEEPGPPACSAPGSAAPETLTLHHRGRADGSARP
ncbi:protein patched homolog 2 [Terrapene carolina triunguis]|uniref:protein patched homolog 2 n=1 Tax=Terrapene triunguis TaxID=2587831 RepID=UPI0011563133|nr:protein patched homolog 2 [Terrapene carolina triunguis]